MIPKQSLGCLIQINTAAEGRTSPGKDASAANDREALATEGGMHSHLDSPFIVFALFLLAQCIAAYIGDFARRKRRSMTEDDDRDFDVVRTATLTLLALMIGFTFSMAVTRYDQRKNLEEAEANAIGTEYLRVDLLPAEAAARGRDLIRKYLDRRVAFYLASDARDVARIDAETAKLQADLWVAVAAAARADPTPVMAVVVSGMNDVLNSQGYTQAAWWNRIPVAAWAMLALTAFFCNVLIGYGERRRGSVLLLVFPVIVSVSFLLIADIDSPRGGIIRVLPQNLIAASQSMRAE
jgi:hypothetical protein